MAENDIGMTSRRELLLGGASAVAGAAVGTVALGQGAIVRRPAQPHTSRAMLIHCGAVLTMDGALGSLRNADLLIRDGKIVAVGRDLKADAEHIDARQMLAMPGFVDGHRHLWEGVVRDTLPTVDLQGYLREVNEKIGPAYSPEDAYLGTLVSALGALDAGITTVLDWSHIQNSAAHTDACIAGLRESGIRAVFGYGPALRKDLGSRWPTDLLELKMRQFASADALVTLALATASPESLPEEVAKMHLKFARDAGVLTTMHAGITGIGRPGMIGKFGKAGLLGPDVNLVHCNILSAEEWRILADTGTSVSLTPFVELQMGHGDPAIQPARDVGITFALGADVEVSTPGDMWSQMRTAFTFQRGAAFRDRHANRPAPTMMTPAEALRYATVGGAIATRLERKIGTLTPGKAADLLLLDMTQVDTMPVSDLESAVLLNMDARNVDSVFVNGVQAKRKGRLIGVDLARLRSRLVESRNRILKMNFAT